jgi:hypothetical protein
MEVILVDSEFYHGSVTGTSVLGSKVLNLRSTKVKIASTRLGCIWTWEIEKGA